MLDVFLSTGHSGDGLRVWAVLRDGVGGGGVCVVLFVVFCPSLGFSFIIII